MANSIKMSERTFLRAFRQEFGTSPKTMVIKQRMNLARQLLEFTEDPIKKIASDLGYTNRRTFTALFSSYIGVSPEAFRHKAALTK
jgi:transcriptional regulator GlxA family with amidase domain